MMRSEAIFLSLRILGRYLKDPRCQELLSRNSEEVGQEFADPDSASRGLFQRAAEAVRSQAIQSFQLFLQGNEDDSPLGLLRERGQIPLLVTPESVSRPFPPRKDGFIGDNVPIERRLSNPI